MPKPEDKQPQLLANDAKPDAAPPTPEAELAAKYELHALLEENRQLRQRLDAQDALAAKRAEDAKAAVAGKEGPKRVTYLAKFPVLGAGRRMIYPVGQHPDDIAALAKDARHQPTQDAELLPEEIVGLTEGHHYERIAIGA